MARILIAGGSLSGLLHATLLRRAGHDVEVYEKVAEDLAGRGGGLATQEPLWRTLEQAGLLAPGDERPGVRLTERVVLNHDGDILDRRDSDQLVTSWDSLYRMLRDALPAQFYHQDRAVKQVNEHPEPTARGKRITLVFDDGTEEDGDLVIAADGAGSALRSQLLPGHDPEYAGYVAWRGLVAAEALDAATMDALQDRMSLYTPDGERDNEQILAYPVTGEQGETAENKRRLNFVWYRPTPEGEPLQQLLTGEDGKQYDHSIPPPAIAGKTIAALHEAAERLLPPSPARHGAGDRAAIFPARV